MKSYEKYLKESTFYFGPDFIAGDDDFPTGNILIGDKYKKVDYYNRLTSFNKKWVPDLGDWKWDIFGAASGQESKDVYHDSLKKTSKAPELKDIASRLFAHMTNKPPVPVPKELRPLGNDIFTDTDSFGNKKEYTMSADTDDDESGGLGRVVKKPTNLTYFQKTKRHIDKYIKRNKGEKTPYSGLYGDSIVKESMGKVKVNGYELVNMHIDVIGQDENKWALGIGDGKQMLGRIEYTTIDNEVHIDWVEVEKGARGKGLGEMMFRHLVKTLNFDEGFKIKYRDIKWGMMSNSGAGLKKQLDRKIK